MALDTYANLQTAIPVLMARTYDTGVVVDAIKLAESRINADLLIEAAAVVTALTMTAGNTATTHDGTALMVRAMRYAQADGGEIIEAGSPERWAEVKTSQSGKPTHFLVRASTIEWNCPPDAAYAVEVETGGRLNLAGTSTNWLLTNVPQLYVHAIAMELIALPERFGEEFANREAMYKRALSDARRLLTRIMAKAEVRMQFDTPDGGSGYDINGDE